MDNIILLIILLTILMVFIYFTIYPMKNKKNGNGGNGGGGNGGGGNGGGGNGGGGNGGGGNGGGGESFSNIEHYMPDIMPLTYPQPNGYYKYAVMPYNDWLYRKEISPYWASRYRWYNTINDITPVLLPNKIERPWADDKSVTAINHMLV